MLIIIDLVLLAILVWFYLQNTRLNRDLNAKNLQLQKTIEDLKTVQIKLLESGKKEAVAALSAGILHQISQPITGIHGFVRFMKKEMDHQSPFYQAVCSMDEQTDYLKAMLANLMELVRHRKIQKTDIDINAVVLKAMNLLADELRIRRIGWDLELDERVRPVFGDGLHLQQVFMNLAVNAIEALGEMPHGSPRTLVVASKYDQVRDQVEITFEDNGPGVPKDLQSKVFDPFFSTKPKGSGIGLALCYDLVLEHGGSISIDSQGAGSTFKIVLPCLRQK